MMTKHPVCCLVSDKVDTIAQMMQTQDVGAIPVIENHASKKLIGIITDRDLAVRVVGASREMSSTLVGDIMTTNPVVCHPGDDVYKALETMATHQVRRIPVVDTYGVVMGIITQADLVIHLHNHDKFGQMIGQISQPDTLPIVNWVTTTPITGWKRDWWVRHYRN